MIEPAACRDLFELDAEISYFNAAYVAPRLKAVSQAGEAALQRTASPWQIKAPDFFSLPNAARAAFAKLFDASADDIAVMPSTSYALETAARVLPLARGQSVLLLDEEFPSDVYPLQRHAHAHGARLQFARKLKGLSWTDSLIAQITPDTGWVVAPPCRWTDGAAIDLARVSAAVQSVGAHLIIDATQASGALPLSIAALRPAIFVSHGYKWLLGPVGISYCYIAPEFQQGAPLEEHWANRARAEDFAKLTDYTDDYQPGARRFDMGARAQPILLPMSMAAMAQIEAWGVENIARALHQLTLQIADALLPLGFHGPATADRSPHMVGLRYDGTLPDDFLQRLVARGVHISRRADALRIAPHLHIGARDIERLVEAVRLSL